ncbi:outer membrane lipocarrier LolA family protein [Neorickettsia helminthoeca str. Oregon]|uniref:Outer membrane lipocarrier LolA family protein n=1 Tax=Neorickettsia helminthoeca str. Oregon TaxID=1286528 RepID=X5GX39_9RICK|nr:outer membrane lipocarrier LolA family protein [Neorickettsia helminthoeca str. Oregon]
MAYLVSVLFFWNVSLAFVTTDGELAELLASFKTLRADFVQRNPDGTKSTGVVFLSLPHRFKIVYQDSGISISGNKGMITYHDSELQETRKFFMSRGDPFLKMLSNVGKLSQYHRIKKAGLSYLETSSNGRKCSIVVQEKPFQIKEIIFENESGEVTHMTFSKAHYNLTLSNDAFALP